MITSQNWIFETLNMIYSSLEIHMENQINIGDQNTQQIGQNPANQPVQISVEPKVNYWMISTLIFSVLFFGILGLYVFSFYKTIQSGTNITSTQPPLSSELVCSQDDDCVIGIQAASCCSCPKAVNKKLIGTKDWTQYEFGKDYSSQQTKSCGGIVACEPCELPEKPICSNGKCQFPSQTDIQPSNTQKQKIGVAIQSEKTTYRLGEPIIFTITNNTQNNVYYFPETCASSLVQVFIVPDDSSAPIQGDQKICMLAPSVETLSPNTSITNKIPDKTLSKMVPGKYKIKFYYSTEKRDRFGIGEQSTIESEILTMVK